MAKRGEKPHLRKRGSRSYGLTHTLANGQRVETTIHAFTKTAARALADERLALEERIRLGLENAIRPMTLEQAFAEYSKTASAKASWNTEEGRWRKHILETNAEGRGKSALSKKLLHSINSHDVEVMLLQKHREGYEPQTVAHIKSHLRRLFTWAIREARILRGDNPASFAKLPEEIPEHEPKAMTEAQLERLFKFGTEDENERLLLLCATYTGERRKELLQLRWENVDEARGWIWVESSRRMKTKTRRSRPIPIHPDVAPFLSAARRTTSSPWVFPTKDGKMRSKYFDAAGFLRRCMLRAELVQGWVQECVARKARANPRQKLNKVQAAEIRQLFGAGRTKMSIAAEFGVSHRAISLILSGKNHPTFRPPGGCGFESELLPMKATGACPTCGAPLKSRPVPLDFTFHNLRSTFGTFVVESTGSLRAAQLFLGHQDEATTKRYARRRDSFLQAQMGLVQILSANKLPTLSSTLLPESALQNTEPYPTRS